MDLKVFATVFATIFVAELGDKTQLATLLYAADAEHGKLTVFVGASAALVLTSALGVAAGAFISQHVSAQVLSWLAGIGFIAIGAWTILRASPGSERAHQRRVHGPPGDCGSSRPAPGRDRSPHARNHVKLKSRDFVNPNRHRGPNFRVRSTHSLEDISDVISE